MPARVSEAIVFETYPFKESDLVVSFLTRDQGKLRGVAKRARRPKSNFGSGLERLSYVKMAYFQKETRELVNLDSCELIRSQFALLGDYGAAVALDYLAEISEQLLPPAEPSERHFRLLLAVLDHMRSGAAGSVWRAATYFSLWAVRLAGILPELHVCLACGNWLENPEAREPAFFSRYRTGLYCGHCRRDADLGKTWELSVTSRDIAEEMLHTPVGQLTHEDWRRETAADLRHFLVRQIEHHIERRLVTADVLEAA
jgi:DNA repair protein RecO (recombination protein O)